MDSVERAASPHSAQHVKRLIDLVGTAVGMVLSFPVMAVVSLGIRVTMGRPVLFRQVRPGQHGVPFTILKFRTMREAYDADGAPLPEAQRLTRLGWFLRKTSLDELPQLWNVLEGEMSLVGPRPLLIEYLTRYTTTQARRHEVKPGVTGWAQVQERNEVPLSRRIELDLWYVDHWSLRLDLTILLLTIIKTVGLSGTQPLENDDIVVDLAPSREWRGD